MPRLVESKSQEVLNEMFRHHGSGITGLTPARLPSHSSSQNTMADSIKYIPAQQDPMAGMSTRAARQNPIRLMLQDVAVLLTMLPYLPNIFLPLKADNTDDELYVGIMNARDTVLQILLFLLEVVLLVLALPAILILPGLLSMVLGALCSLVVYLIVKPMEGPKVVYSNVSQAVLAKAEQHKEERWIFINGCAVGHAGLQRNVDRIAETFGRAVIGIHNRTYGLIADIIECIIQRSFSYQTLDVRVAHSYLKATLVDPTVKRVILIGHSQGGIIVSMVLDQLFTELPGHCFSKLEIYTFGSAASHFSNPLASLPSKRDGNDSPLFSPPKSPSENAGQPKHLISHIEHYANEKDMVPRWGVLHCTQDILNNRYAGSVFVRLGASGHMFNQHYMDAMFPLVEDSNRRLQDEFLNQVIQVDEELATKRESMALTNMGHMRQQSGIAFGDGQVLPGIAKTGDGGPMATDEPILTFARTNSGRLLAEEAQGKSVKELSRLWKYQGGRLPLPDVVLRRTRSHGSSTDAITSGSQPVEFEGEVRPTRLFTNPNKCQELPLLDSDGQDVKDSDSS